MEKDFFIVVGIYKNDGGETKEWEQSVHVDFDKAYIQLMANGMSTASIEWRIDRYYGRKVSTIDK